MAERLHFGAGEMPYHAMSAAEHLSRYAVLREACVGKRVLDVACGEGYGAHLLAEWGAREVVAVDIAPEAIAQARRLFASDKIRFLVGDVCQLDDILGGDERFDIICSFETIEHLQNPAPFLAFLRRRRETGSLIALSAPNDRILPAGENNPYHFSTFDFQALRTLLECALGPVDHWFFGVPMQGYMLTPNMPATPSEDMQSAMRLEIAGQIVMIPPQAYTQPTVDTVHFWLAIWGGDLPVVTVGAPQSMTSWREPWLALEHLKAEVEKLEAKVVDLTDARERGVSEVRRLGQALAEERRMTDALLASDTRRSDASSDLPSEQRHQTFTTSVNVDYVTMKAIAREVWREKRHRGFRRRIRRFFRRLAGKPLEPV